MSDATRRLLSLVRMNEPISAIMLAGTLRPSPLRAALDVPLLCLPMGREGTVLGAWLSVLRPIEQLETVTIVLSTHEDLEAVQRRAAAGGHRGRPEVRTIVEPAAWRGTGGVLHDASREMPEESTILAIEANTMPPESLAPLLARFEAPGEAALNGVVGYCGFDEPAGVYAFTRRALGQIPPIGYHDVKEQFLPALNKEGMRVGAARLGDRTQRMRDREGYLAGVRNSLAGTGENNAMARIAPDASVAAAAIVDGACIIQPGAVIEARAVVHESVVLDGATVGTGAIISQSVIGPRGKVSARGRVIHEVVGKPETPGRRKTVIRSTSHAGREA